jgi:hypothetical protein
MQISLVWAVYSIVLPMSQCGLTKTEELSRKVQEIELVAEKILLPLFWETKLFGTL